MTIFTTADKLHRLVKHALDSGAASSLAEAEAMFRGYCLSFVIDAANAGDKHHQAALLTGITLGRRVFLGGVSATGALDVPLAVPSPLGATLGEAVVALGGSVGAAEVGTPIVVIGGAPKDRAHGFQVRTFFSGWRGGVVPGHTDPLPEPGNVMPLAPMLAAALAVSEAFQFVSKEGCIAGRRPVGLSLWNPAPASDWLETGSDGPVLQFLPSRLWLIGLGHLGQAYLWALGLLPYSRPSGVELVLQDVDLITPSTLSTSVLSEPGMIGLKKTRAMAAWAERRGFTTSIHERLFDGSFRRQAGEPTVALCGMDNALGRHALDQVGFDFVVEAGLGRGYGNFRTMRLHTLPGTRSAAEIWKAAGDEEPVQDRAAYIKMLEDGELDKCGITLLAGKAVGAPFVGAVAACLAVSEVLRLLHGAPVHQLIDVDLRSIDHRLAVPTARDFSSLNPGYVLATHCGRVLAG
jgi:hypothetical protein